MNMFLLWEMRLSFLAHLPPGLEESVNLLRANSTIFQNKVFGKKIEETASKIYDSFKRFKDSSFNKFRIIRVVNGVHS